MAAFHSPVANPAGWTFSLAGLQALPPGLRYSGERLVALRATRAAAAEVRMPALGVLRKVTPATGDPDAGRTFVEVQVNPIPIRRVAQAVPFGLPTFYLVFDVGSSPVTFADGDTAAADDPLGTVTAITVLCAGQDRVVRDPALWSAEILAAIGAGGGTPGPWQDFATAVASQTASGATAPVLVLDHTGRPRSSGSIDVTAGGTSATATLTAADAGDLQRAVARLNAANPATMPFANLFGGGVTSVTLQPDATGTGDVQLARLEDALFAAVSIAATTTQRHVTFTDLHDWFAAQFVTPTPAGTQALERYTRGNKLTPLVNGPAYFDDLFRKLQDARAAGVNGGFHLAGWAMFPQTEFTQRRSDDPSDLPITLEEAAKLIGAAGGGTRFLPAQYFQLSANSPVVPAEILLFSLIVTGLLMLKDVDLFRSDGAGLVILVALLLINAIAISVIVAAGGRPVEPNRHAVNVLDPIANAESRFAPFPADVADNQLSPPLSGFPFNELFTLIRNFGVYHQKFGVVLAGGNRFGYCGGIDLNPDRLDDIRHLSRAPYHDVHTRVEGPAVRDLELSFKERWTRDGGGAALAFEPPTTPAALGTPGEDAVQVARTYFAAASATRALEFAPGGDRTIANTMLAALMSASEFVYIEDQYLTPPLEYRTALIGKVQNREIRKLVITVPGITDQPFGELVRSGLITSLRNADAGAGIVHIGYPRRHYTVPDNELRASSGRCLLMQALASSGGIEPAVFLGPVARLPDPPFWVAIEGELMYAYNESTVPSTDPDAHAFEVLRGAETRLVKGGPVSTAVGARTRAHAAGAAATVIDLTNIYVHAKMMIVDDVFLGVGSANLNRRGLYHDGEINVFTVPQALKTNRANPIAALRRSLWAEMLDLPIATAGPLLEDPVAAAHLFDRSPFAGNRYTDVEAFPTHLMLDATTGDGAIGALIKLAVTGFIAVDHLKLYDGVVDPTSSIGGP
jgi:phosphatidylserine/phosphatidylglycerophosphate/cardiolipin synthase-like enzyme